MCIMPYKSPNFIPTTTNCFCNLHARIKDNRTFKRFFYRLYNFIYRFHLGWWHQLFSTIQLCIYLSPCLYFHFNQSLFQYIDQCTNTYFYLILNSIGEVTTSSFLRSLNKYIINHMLPSTSWKNIQIFDMPLTQNI